MHTRSMMSNSAKLSDPLAVKKVLDSYHFLTAAVIDTNDRLAFSDPDGLPLAMRKADLPPEPTPGDSAWENWPPIELVTGNDEVFCEMLSRLAPHLMEPFMVLHVAHCSEGNVAEAIAYRVLPDRATVERIELNDSRWIDRLMAA